MSEPSIFRRKLQTRMRLLDQRCQVGHGDIAFAEIVDLDQRQRDEAVGMAAIDDALGEKLMLLLRRVQSLAGVGQHQRAALALEQQRIAVDGFEDGRGVLAQFGEQMIEAQFHDAWTSWGQLSVSDAS